MITKQKPMQTCDIAPYKIIPIGIKTTTQFQPIGIKNFTKTPDCKEKCANVGKSINTQCVNQKKSMLNDSLIRL